MIVGVSTNTIGEIQGALADGADYIGFGPMYPTASKKDANEVVTADVIRFALHQCPIPVVTIGGISVANIASLYDQGFRSFAMISAIISQPDIKAAVENLRKLLAK